MCDKELLVACLYDDLADGDRAIFESHLRGCAACREELKALGAVRADLATWAPPQPDFGFRVIRGGRDGPVQEVQPPVQSWRAWWTPAAGLAAAAVLVLAAASAIARVEVRRGPDGVTVRTGWSAFAPAGSSGSVGETRPDIQPASPPASQNPQGGEGGQPRSADGGSPVDAAFLAAIERRLNALESSSRDAGLRNASTMSARASDAEIIRRVRDLLAQSENKQQGELALRIAQVIRDVDAQRVADLARIQKGLGQIGATVAEEAASHRDLTNYILTSARQK